MGDLATLPTFQPAPTGYTHTDFNAVFAALTIANGAVTTNKLGDGAVTFQKMASVASGTLLGRSTAGAGAVEALTLGAGIALAAGVLSVGWLDTNSSHRLRIACGSDLTADKTITFTPGDTDRTITLTGSPTLADWFDQSVKTTASPAWAGATITAAAGPKLSLVDSAAGGATWEVSVNLTSANNFTIREAGTGNWLTIAKTTGLVTIPGALSVSGGITGGAISGTTGTFTGNVTLDNAASPTLILDRGASTDYTTIAFKTAGASTGGWEIYGTNAANQILTVYSFQAGATVGQWTSTGYQGVIGATTPAAATFSIATIGSGGTGATAAQLNMNGGSGTAGGSIIVGRTNSVDKFYIGAQATVSGGTAQDLYLYSVSDHVKILPAGTLVGDWSNTGLAITGNLVATSATSGLQDINASGGGRLQLFGSAHATLPNQAYLDANTIYLRTSAGSTVVTVTSTAVSVVASTASTSTGTGAVVVTGGVGIGGAVYIGGVCNAASFNTTSSRRFKRNINPMLDGADLLRRLQPVRYDEAREGGRTGLPGLIAEDVDAVLPSLVSRDAEQRVAGLNYAQLVSPLIAGWQDHDNRLAAIERTLHGAN